MRRISWGSVQGILIAGLMRVLVFLAVFGVVSQLPPGQQLDARGPVFDGINMNLSFNVSLRNLAFRREPFTTQVVNRACPWA